MPSTMGGGQTQHFLTSRDYLNSNHSPEGSFENFLNQKVFNRVMLRQTGVAEAAILPGSLS